MKLCFVDLETTGTDPAQHGIVQIAGQLCINAKKENFKFRMQIFPEDKVDLEAIKIHGLEPTAGHAPKTVHAELVKLFSRYVDKYDKRDKLFFIAYNAQFDNAFLRKFFEKCGDKYFGSWFWFPYIDVMTLALSKLMNKRHGMENFKLGTVCRYLGIEFDMERAHGAEYDIAKTAELCDKLELFSPFVAKAKAA